MNIRKIITAIMALVTVLSATILPTLAATPGTYYSYSGNTVAVIDENQNMTVTWQGGESVRVDVGDMSGKPRFGDTADHKFLGIDFMNVEFDSGILSIGVPTKRGDRLTYAQVPQWKVDLINAEPLNPQKTGHKDLDDAVEAKLAELLSGDMTNAQKLIAVYNFVLDSNYWWSIYDFNVAKDRETETKLLSFHSCENALALLEQGAGVCDNYSALFAVMANAVGFETYEMRGQINGNGHVWTLLSLGGRLYIFDPQAEQVNIQGNQVRYVNFLLDPAYVPAYVPVEGYLALQKQLRP